MFSSSLIITAFIGATLCAIATAILSVFVALKKASFMSEAFSHISFAGIAIALLIGLDITAVSIIFVLFVSVLIAYITKKFKNEPVNVTTIFLSLSMAIAVILLSLKKGYSVDISSYLFGNVLFITNYDLIYLLSLLIVNIVFVVLFYNQLFYSTYNSEISKVYGIKTNLIYYIWTSILAINIVLSVKSVGIILITALLILPGLTALNLIKNIKIAIVLAIMFSLFSTVLGFFITYFYNLPSGALIVCINFVFYLFSLIFSFFKKSF